MYYCSSLKDKKERFFFLNIKERKIGMHSYIIYLPINILCLNILLQLLCLIRNEIVINDILFVFYLTHISNQSHVFIFFSNLWKKINFSFFVHGTSYFLIKVEYPHTSFSSHLIPLKKLT